MLRTAIVLACATLVYGQSFEVASVKPSPPPGTGRSLGRQVRGGPGSTDPGAIEFSNIDLFSLVTLAYGIDAYQLSAPAWLAGARFDIIAKLPPNVTREQYRLMLQNLLAERFQLTAHRDRKDGQAFDLVAGKSGPRLTESTGPRPPGDDGSLQPAPSVPHPPAGYTGPIAVACARCTISQFAARLSGLLGQPVHDATGLTGTYDFRLQYSSAGLQADASAGANPAPLIFDALQEQLGLKLVPKKASVELLVIDRIEKVPTEN